MIDFIDMESAKNQREVENRLRDALRHDRARVQIGKISRFGLLELSRQRLQPSLEETTHSPCPRCHGTGFIRDTASTALHVLRILQEEAMKENTAAIHAQVPVDVATYLLNEKRSEIFGIEARLKVNVLLIPNPHLETPNYQVERLRHDAPQLDEQKPSYEMVTVPDEEAPALPHARAPRSAAPRPEPLVKGITPDQPAPMSVERDPDVGPDAATPPAACRLRRVLPLPRSHRSPRSPLRLVPQVRRARRPRRWKSARRSRSQRHARRSRIAAPVTASAASAIAAAVDAAAQRRAAWRRTWRAAADGEQAAEESAPNEPQQQSSDARVARQRGAASRARPRGAA